MDKTINGRPAKEAFCLLQSPFTGKKDEKNGYSFIPIKGFLGRMNTVFSPENIWVEFTEPKLILLTMTGQEAFVVKCHLTIFDDDGNIYRRTDGIGTLEILPSREGGRQAGLGNCPASAATLAYKDACKRLGIFGKAPVDEITYSEDGASENKKSKQKGEKITLSFTTQKAFSEKATSKGSSWRCPIVVQDENNSKTEGILVVFDNIYKSSEKVQRLIATAADTKKLIVKAEVIINTTYEKNVNYILQKIL